MVNPRRLSPVPGQPGGRPFLARFWAGLRTPAIGLRFLLANPGLFRYAIVPILLNLLISLLALAILIAVAVWFLVYFHPRFPGGLWGWILEVAAAVAAVIVCGGVALGMAFLLNEVLCGYFRERLARKVDMLLGLRTDQMHEAPYLDQIVSALVSAAKGAAVGAGLLALNLIPVIGSIAAIVLGGYLGSRSFGREYLEMPMMLRGHDRRRRGEFLAANSGEVLGLGLSLTLLMLVPLLGSLLLAAAAAGVVLLYRQCADDEA